MSPLPINPSTQKDFRDDFGVIGAPWGVEDSTVLPVKAIGAGIPRINARQRIKTYLISKSAAATSYTQVATVTPTLKISFLGVQGHIRSTNTWYVEDADTGNIAPTDDSVVGLYYSGGASDNTQNTMPSFPRECTRGIRVRVTNSAATASQMIVYFLEEDVAT